MANIWSRLRGREDGTEERLSTQDYVDQWMNYNGGQYPLLGLGMGGGAPNRESVGNDFAGYVNGLYKSSGVVFACCTARMMPFTEMRFQYQRFTDGRPGDLFDAPGLDVLEHPWPNGTTGELLARAMQDTDFAGNHYIVRENNRLRRLRPDWVDVVLSAPATEAVQSDVVGYLYYPGGDRKAEGKLYLAGDRSTPIAHWSPIPDPEAQYRGMSWLTPVLREIQADKAAGKHKQKFFENGATPNLAVSMKETVSHEQFQKFMRSLDEKHGGVDNAYKTLYLGGGADVKVVGQQMQEAFKVLQGQNETRIAAAARVPSMIVGFTEGMQGQLLAEQNLSAAKDLLGSGTLRPLWRSLCASYSVLVPERENARLWYDDRDIAFLREDRHKIAEQQQSESLTISRLVMNGYTPDSSVRAVVEKDWRLLEHTGLFSVQLIPPGQEKNPKAAEPATDSGKDDK